MAAKGTLTAGAQGCCAGISCRRQAATATAPAAAGAKAGDA